MKDHQLRALVQVAESGSIRAVARAMNLSQSALTKALRELEEETGLRASASDLVGPVMRRVAAHGYSDQVCEQSECFYVLRTDRFEVDTAGHTPDELRTLAGHAWLPLDGLADLPDEVWPGNLPEMVASAGTPDAWPGDVGRVEESTVPI